MFDTPEYQEYLKDQQDDNCAQGYDELYLNLLFEKFPELHPEKPNPTVLVEERVLDQAKSTKKRKAYKTVKKEVPVPLDEIDLDAQPFQVLDVGSREFRSWEYWRAQNIIPLGIDVGKEGLEYCKANNKWNMRELDAQRMTQELKWDHYDFVTAFHCLEHMLNLDVALGEILTVTKPGGYFYLAVPCPCENVRKGHWQEIKDPQKFIDQVAGNGWGQPVWWEYKEDLAIRPEREILALFRKPE